MKKILLTTILALFFICVSASAAQTDYVMITEKIEGDHSWGEFYKHVGVDKSTGKRIPISNYDGSYFYAYVPEGTDVAFESVEKIAFNDINQEWGDPAGLSELSRRGIFVGDENGNFNEYETLSRAQMAALLARVLSVDGETPGDMPFADVPEDSWFASPVYALYSRGIVAGDTYFDPDRPVTREELTAMMYRIICALGGRLDSEGEPTREFLDFGDVSEYARDAYRVIITTGYNIPSDVDYGSYIDEYGNFYDLLDCDAYLHPQQTVTRGEASEFLYYTLIQGFIRLNVPAIARDTAVTFGLDTEMPRITGSTSTYPITYTLYSQLFRNCENHPMFPKGHDKTIDSYKLLIDGQTDVILVPDPNSEVKALADEMGVELEYTPISNEGLVFFTAKDNSAENLIRADIERIYVDNSVTNWNEIGGPDAVFTPFCRNNDSGSHAQMEQFFLHGREIHADIRREHTSLAMSTALTEVENYNRFNPGSYALGYSMYYYYKNTVLFDGTDELKLLSVDGVMPTTASLADGSYPLSTHYFAVIRADEPENSPARKLVSLLKSEAGQECIAGAGFGSTWPDAE